MTTKKGQDLIRNIVNNVVAREGFVIKEEKENKLEKIKIGDVDLEIGDEILTGKFKNKKVIVKSFGKDENGQPTVNGKPALNFRIKKLMPPKEKKAV